MAYCGRLGLVAITHDVRIRYRPNELAAVQRHGVTLLVVVGKAPLPELARSFVASRRRIEALLDSQGPPLIAKVYRPGAAELAKNPEPPVTFGSGIRPQSDERRALIADRRVHASVHKFVQKNS